MEASETSCLTRLGASLRSVGAKPDEGVEGTVSP